jgi:hypothetical protein
MQLVRAAHPEACWSVSHGTPFVPKSKRWNQSDFRTCYASSSCKGNNFVMVPGVRVSRSTWNPWLRCAAFSRPSCNRNEHQLSDLPLNTWKIRTKCLIGHRVYIFIHVYIHRFLFPILTHVIMEKSVFVEWWFSEHYRYGDDDVFLSSPFCLLLLHLNILPFVFFASSSSLFPSTFASSSPFYSRNRILNSFCDRFLTNWTSS